MDAACGLVRSNASYAIVVATGVVAVAPTCVAAINLELRPDSQLVSVGETVSIGLYAVSDSKSNQSFSGIQSVISWDNATLALTGIDQTDAVDLLSSDFPDDPCNLNEVNPPQDGNGLHVAMANLGDPVWATPEGVLVTTFQFELVKPACAASSEIDLLPSAGEPECETAVFHGKEPNTNITGSITGATIVLDQCPADIDKNGQVDVDDLGEVFIKWGLCTPAPPCCSADIDRNGSVDVDDLGTVFIEWGVACP